MDFTNTHTPMDKIYTHTNNSNVDWKNDVLLPISLFSLACLILLLSSFSTKASYEAAEVKISDQTIIIEDFTSTPVGESLEITAALHK